jgi:hypothetical protein
VYVICFTHGMQIPTGCATTHRPYQPARPWHSALQELQRCAGTQCAPLLVQQCIPYLQTRVLVHLVTEV